LDFDQVRHFRDFADVPEKFTNTLTAGEILRQMMSHVAPRTSSKWRISRTDISLAARKKTLTAGICPIPALWRNRR
jgi:hypothetical protein